MKTNRSAWRLVKICRVLLGFVLLGMVAAAFGLGHTVAHRTAHAPLPHTDDLHPSSASVADMVAFSSR